MGDGDKFDPLSEVILVTSIRDKVRVTDAITMSWAVIKYPLIRAMSGKLPHKERRFHFDVPTDIRAVALDRWARYFGLQDQTVIPS